MEVGSLLPPCESWNQTHVIYMSIMVAASAFTHRAIFTVLHHCNAREHLETGCRIILWFLKLDAAPALQAAAFLTLHCVDKCKVASLTVTSQIPGFISLYWWPLFSPSVFTVRTLKCWGAGEAASSFPHQWAHFPPSAPAVFDNTAVSSSISGGLP